MRLKLVVSILLFFLGLSANAEGKFGVMAGYYSFTSKSSTANGSLSTFGVYNISYQRPLMQKLELALGYTIFYSKGISGDMGFGPDISFAYFPFSESAQVDSQKKDGTVSVQLNEEWRPYFGGGFSHRQFQSLNTSFAGFTAFAGTEYSRGNDFSYRLEIRQSLLNGPSESSISQTDIFVGLSFPL